MIIIHWLLNLSILIHCIWRGIKFNFYTVALISFQIYMMPTYFGKTYINNIYFSEIDPRIYLIVDFIILFLYYKMQKVKYFNYEVIKQPDKITRINIIIILIMIYIALIYCILDVGIVTLSLHKKVFNELVNTNIYNFAIWGSLITYCYGLIYKRKGIIFFSTIVIIFTLFVGSRAFIATLFIITLAIKWRESINILKTNKKGIIIAIFIIFSLLVYKTIYKDIKTFDFISVFNKLTSKDTYIDILYFPESYTTFSLFNYVVDTGYNIDLQTSIHKILSVIPFYKETDGIILRMSAIFKNYIFYTSYGLANSIWGEVFAMGKYIGIVIFTILWGTILRLGNRYLFIQRIKSIFIIPVVTYIAFYVNRLDLVQIYGPIKNVILIYIIYSIIDIIMRSTSRNNKINL